MGDRYVFERSDQLLLDIGNTRVHWRLGERRGDVLHDALYHRAPGDWPWAGGQINEVVCACVGEPNVKTLLRQASVSTWRELLTPTPELLPTVYDSGQLGHDRWLAVLGAAVRFPQPRHQPVLVVDAGTAVKVDLLSSVGHEGGWIMPGYRLWHTTLYGATQIRRPPADQALPKPGTNTAEAIANAWLLAVGGLVQSVQLHHPNATLLLTGGDAERLLAQWHGAEVCQDLVLMGLEAWASGQRSGNQ